MNGPVHLFEPLRHDALPLVVMSIVGVGIGYLVFHIAIDYASIAQVATTVTTMPIFVGLSINGAMACALTARGLLVLRQYWVLPC